MARLIGFDICDLLKFAQIFLVMPGEIANDSRVPQKFRQVHFGNAASCLKPNEPSCSHEKKTSCNGLRPTVINPCLKALVVNNIECLNQLLSDHP